MRRGAGERECFGSLKKSFEVRNSDGDVPASKSPSLGSAHFVSTGAGLYQDLGMDKREKSWNNPVFVNVPCSVGFLTAGRTFRSRYIAAPPNGTEMFHYLLASAEMNIVG